MKKYYEPFRELIKKEPPIYGFYKSRFTKEYKIKTIIATSIMCVIFLIFFYIFFEVPLIVLFYFIAVFVLLIISVIFMKSELRAELPKIIELDEEVKEKIKQELINLEILHEGQALKIIGKIAYSDPDYAKKRFRKWAWKETEY